ncbi:hypothetical protein [Alkalimonas sp.]|nr:hypothetical protein [Alkalimonas sp.]MCC5826542.1 hypothetical protein [Alkalimonas sp.]
MQVQCLCGSVKVTAKDHHRMSVRYNEHSNNLTEAEAFARFVPAPDSEA